MSTGCRMSYQAVRRKVFVYFVMFNGRELLLLLSNNECLSALHAIPSLLEKTKEETSKKNFVHSRIKFLSHELQTINIYIFRIPHQGEFLKKQNIDNQVKTNLTNHNKSKNAFVASFSNETSRNLEKCFCLLVWYEATKICRRICLQVLTFN